jgi:hypothetical protein
MQFRTLGVLCVLMLSLSAGWVQPSPRQSRDSFSCGAARLLVNGARPPEHCRSVISGWTEVEFLDVITGRYGVDREPVFTVECDAPALLDRVL